MTHEQIIETLLSRLEQQAAEKSTETDDRTGIMEFEEDFGTLTVVGECYWSVLWENVEGHREADVKLTVSGMAAYDWNIEEDVADFPTGAQL
jgi:hypothetical protein